MRNILWVLMLAAGLSAADATGRWVGTLNVTKPDGVTEKHPALIVLKQEGTRLTGTAGPDASEQHAIDDGKAEDGRLTFQIPANSMKFDLKLAGEDITGEVTREREGRKQTAGLTLSREK